MTATTAQAIDPITQAGKIMSDAASDAAVILLQDLPQKEQRYIRNKIMLPAEKALIEQVMQLHEGNQKKSAKTLGINRATLRDRLRRYYLL